MSSIERQRKYMETMIIKTHPVGQANEYYRQYKQDQFEQPQLVMYQLLRSIIRKQIRQPYQRIKSVLSISFHDELQIQRRHSKYELQVIGDNITNVITSIQQRLVIQSFISIKNTYSKQIRREYAYYNQENITELIRSLVYFQNQASHFKKQAFRKFYNLYQHEKNLLVKSNNSSNSKEISQINFQTKREIQAINSYIIDNEQEQGKSLNIIKRTNKQSRFSRQQHKQIKQYQSIENHFQSAQSKNKRVKQYNADSNHNEELQSKVFITHHKNTHNHQQQQSHNLKQHQNHVFLIQDYRIKPKQPTNFIKIPMPAENVKIVQVQTGRKSSNKKRVVREEQQIQRQICQDCKYCRQMKQRKLILKVVQQRLRKEIAQ